ncbi:MAG: class I SAM-dependent rRNA methyltransferase [Helicobacteraceae bacterium]|nr:class I SAM-dependent rRNA methyltransferase [Candidatus Sulfurimonas ponti]
MNNEISLTIKSEYVTKYKDGYPLILKETLESTQRLSQEGLVLKLLDNKNKFIAKAYYGLQNKGIGWILSLQEDEKIDLDFFIAKIQKAIESREVFYKDASTNAFRVFNGEGDGIGGLSIDYFNGYYMITWYSIGIFEFRDVIVQALKSCVDYKGVYQKKRFDTKGMYLGEDDDFVCGAKAPEPLIVQENGVNFAIYLDDGAMVGVFLDQKDVRKAIRDKYANAKSVLNTFSYTGAFSVYAALGGAKKTTSVDLAKRSLAKTKEQFEVNEIDSTKQEIIVDDVFDYFKYAVRKRFLFDMVVLDPPSFARSKKRTFSASKDYVKLLKEAIQITNKNGLIVASTNAANFSMFTFRDFIKKAFNDLKLKYKVEESFSLPKDFKVNPKFQEGNYLKVVFIRKL